MINNSSLGKWVRLQQKNLDHQFINEIVHGLNCSPFEAKAVLESVYNVYGHYFEICAANKNGQISFQVVAVSNGPQVPLKKCKLTSVTLTLDAGEEDLAIRRKTKGIAGLRRHRIERVCHEAFQQGGLLTVEDLANRLFNCSERTLSRDLSHFRKKDNFIPLRSTVKDMGRTLSHYTPIIKQWLKGKEYTEISRNTCHSISAVNNYIEKFKRVIALHKNDFDINTVAFLAKVSVPLAKEHLNIYQNAEIIDHRQSEIKNFLKKNLLNFNSGDRNDQNS